MAKPTAEEVNTALNTHLGAQSGLFGPSAAYAFMMGWLIQRSPGLVEQALEAHKRFTERKADA